MKIFGTMAKILGWIGVGIGVTAITGYCRAKNDQSCAEFEERKAEVERKINESIDQSLKKSVAILQQHYDNLNRPVSSNDVIETYFVDKDP